MNWKSLIPHIILLVLQVMFFGLIIDDAFITYRYANNFLNTGVLTYNIGEFQQEGFSSILWVFILVPFGTYMPIVSKILGGMFGHLTLVGLGFWGNNGKYDYIRPLILSLIPFFAVQTMNGMGTVLFIFLILCYFFTKSDRPIVRSIVLLLIAMTRVEGIVFVGVMILYELYSQREIKVLFTGLPVAFYHFIRVVYFQSLLSIPSIQKTGFGHTGTVYVLHFAADIAPLIVLIFYGLIYSDMRKPIPKIIISAVCLGAVVSLMKPWMGFGGRFVIPVIIPLLLLIDSNRIKSFWNWSCEMCKNRNLTCSKKNFLCRKVFIRLLLLFILLTPMAQVGILLDDKDECDDTVNNVFLKVALFMNERGYKTVAVGAIGLIGYNCPNCTILDTTGLVTREIVEDGHDLTWFWSQQPDAIIMYSNTRFNLTLIKPMNIEIFQSQYFSDNYYLVEKMLAINSEFSSWIYEFNGFAVL